MIEYTLLNVLMIELKVYCGPDKFYERSKFGQYDKKKNRAPLSNNLLSGNTDYQEALNTLRNYTKTKLQSFNEFRIRPIDETEVFSMPRKLQTNKSTGVDCLRPRLLKLSAPVISKCVAHMIN